MRIFFGYKPPLSAWIGIIIVVTYILVAIFAPAIAPHDQFESIGDTWENPSAEFWLGTDQIGRDIFSRLVYGARITISVALITTILSFFIGVSTGFLAAVGGKTIDTILTRYADVMLSIPLLIFALIILSVFGSSIPTLILTIALLDSNRVFLLARSVARYIVVMEYVEVARLRGEGLWWVMRREVLPNAMPPLIAEFGLRYCFNFLFVAGLSFLGLGIQPPLADWGGMVRGNAEAISFGLISPLWPAMAIALMTIAVTLIVDWVLAVNAGRRGASANM